MKYKIKDFVSEKNQKEVFKMSFLVYQKQILEFLNNYLKYKRFISRCSDTTVDQSYFDLRTFFRYINNNLILMKILRVYLLRILSIYL